MTCTPAWIPLHSIPAGEGHASLTELIIVLALDTYMTYIKVAI
jgi:hypothetical protein